MPSELQRVAQGLVGVLDEVPRVAGYLQDMARRCRDNAAFVGGMSNNPAAQRAAMQLDEAARRCEEAAHYLSQAPPKARAWAEEMVSGVRTSGPGSSPGSKRPDAASGRPAPVVDRQEKDTNARPAKSDGGHRRLTGGDLLSQLPVRRVTPNHRQKTEGAWQDDEGTIHKLISGRHEPDFEFALAHAKKLGLIPERGTLGTAADVELKFAMKMRREDIMKAVIAVNQRPCPGRLGCDQLLKRFLAPGAELVIHGPDSFEKTYRGEPETQ